jgi:hypothetical protein
MSRRAGLLDLDELASDFPHRRTEAIAHLGLGAILAFEEKEMRAYLERALLAAARV